jgi:hypothetical protein
MGLFFTTEPVAQELAGQFHRIVVDNKTGHYNLYGQMWGSTTLEPLLAPGPPYSCYATIKKGGDIPLKIPGDSIVPVVVRGDRSISISWDMGIFTVVETISLVIVNSSDSGTVEFVKHDISIENLGRTDTFEVRILLDIFKKGDEFFITPEGNFIGTEESFTKNNYPETLYWGTPGESGQYLYLPKDFKTLPERVVLAGWNRLDSSLWDFPLEKGRVFYSFPDPETDAALALYFTPGQVKQGQRTTITYYTGMSPEFLVPADVDGVSQDNAEEIRTGSASAQAVPDKYRLFILETRLAEIDDFLERIEIKINSGEAISNVEMEQFGMFLETLEDRKKEYEEIR